MKVFICFFFPLDAPMHPPSRSHQPQDHETCSGTVCVCGSERGGERGKEGESPALLLFVCTSVWMGSRCVTLSLWEPNVEVIEPTCHAGSVSSSLRVSTSCGLGGCFPQGKHTFEAKVLVVQLESPQQQDLYTFPLRLPTWFGFLGDYETKPTMGLVAVFSKQSSPEKESQLKTKMFVKKNLYDIWNSSIYTSSNLEWTFQYPAN